MKHKNYFLKLISTASLVILLLFLPTKASALDDFNNWQVVSETTTGIQYVDSGTAEYDKKGILSILTKYTQLDPETHEIVSTNIYQMLIDCDRRLFKDVLVNGNPVKEPNWESSIDDKLIKKTIIKSCTF